jgi:hypothetical protein
VVAAELVPINIIEDVKQGGPIGLQGKYGNMRIVQAFKNTRKKTAEEWLRKIENEAEKLGVKAECNIRF